MKHKVSTDEVRDTMGRLVAVEHLTDDLQAVRYGYDEGRAVVFVKIADQWFRLHTDPPNPTIANALAARSP